MSFINAVKNFIGMETEDDYYDDFEESAEQEKEEERPKKTYSFTKRASKSYSYDSGASESSGTGQIKIIKPNGFNDSARVAAEIRSGRTVIFNVLDLEQDEARRVVDFVAGAVYGVDGNIRRVAERIFVGTPHGVPIDTDNIKAQARNSVDWL